MRLDVREKIQLKWEFFAAYAWERPMRTVLLDISNF